jgi:hypothetical protein
MNFRVLAAQQSKDAAWASYLEPQQLLPRGLNPTAASLHHLLPLLRARLSQRQDHQSSDGEEQTSKRRTGGHSRFRKAFWSATRVSLEGW